MKRKQILCVMRMPPDLNGHGGSQRAWHLLHALQRIGDVHFVLLFRGVDRDCIVTSLTPIQPLVASTSRIEIPGWLPSVPRYGLPGGLWDIVNMGSQEAPRLSATELSAIAAKIPIKHPDLIFAGRLCTAVIVQDLLNTGMLSAPLRIVDFDDIMSKFRRRRLTASGKTMNWRKRLGTGLDARIIARSEKAIADEWHSVSVCTDEDVEDLRRGNSTRAVVKIPNVVLRDRLPPRRQDGIFRILFVGNLRFPPNVEGLTLFVEKCMPLLRRSVPTMKLNVVGLDPDASVEALARDHDFQLDANVPTLQPFYQDCDVVIAPILFGSGTRIKILEAMAFGRTVVSTTIGAEGMGLVDGAHVLLADDMASFSAALERLASDQAFNLSIAQRAHEFQQRWYTPAAIDDAVTELVEQGQRRANG